MLFQREHVRPILVGEKTQTRRTRRAVPGHIHKAKTRLFSRHFFAALRITGARRERLGDISFADCLKEGYGSREEYFNEWDKIQRKKNKKYKRDLDIIVWVIDFKVL